MHRHRVINLVSQHEHALVERLERILEEVEVDDDEDDGEKSSTDGDATGDTSTKESVVAKPEGDEKKEDE